MESIFAYFGGFIIFGFFLIILYRIWIDPLLFAIVCTVIEIYLCDREKSFSSISSYIILPWKSISRMYLDRLAGSSSYTNEVSWRRKNLEIVYKPPLRIHVHRPIDSNREDQQDGN